MPHRGVSVDGLAVAGDRRWVAGSGDAGPRATAGRRRPGRARTRPGLLHRKHSTPLLRELGSRLRVTVIHRKVADDHGHWQGDREYASEGAERTDEHAHIRLGHHVAVADRGHRDQGPPQTQRYTLEIVLRVVLDALRVVDQTREDDDAED